MSEEWTCGKGLAAHAGLPLAISDLMASMATMLERHTAALDPQQPAGQAEIAAYASLVDQHVLVAEALRKMGNELTSYATLPMAEHDMDVLMSEDFDLAFRTVVAAEHALLELLRTTLDEHERMLKAD